MTQLLVELSTDSLLDVLDDERQKFTRADKGLMRFMVDQLILRGVYPAETVEKNPNTVFSMVECWGARWHVWKEPLACPHCKADLRDHRVGPPFKREMGITVRDRTDHYLCPDCKGTIPR